MKNVLYETACMTEYESDWAKFKEARNKYVNKINYACKMHVMKNQEKEIRSKRYVADFEVFN